MTYTCTVCFLHRSEMRTVVVGVARTPFLTWRVLRVLPQCTTWAFNACDSRKREVSCQILNCAIHAFFHACGLALTLSIRRRNCPKILWTTPERSSLFTHTAVGSVYVQTRRTCKASFVQICSNWAMKHHNIAQNDAVHTAQASKHPFATISPTACCHPEPAAHARADHMPISHTRAAGGNSQPCPPGPAEPSGSGALAAAC
jgi:hypothetical protein